MTSILGEVLVHQASGERDLSLDALKLVMAVMVLALHGQFLHGELPVISHFLVQGVFRTAVPTFFIITGFYLERQFASHGLAWFKRVFFMFALWTAIYSFVWLDVSSLSMKTSLVDVIIGYYHLWYLVGLMGGAAGVLFIRRISTSFVLLFAICLALFTIGVVVQYAGNWHVVEDPWWDRKFNGVKYYRNFLFFALPFIGLGVLIQQYNDRLKRVVPALPILLPLSFSFAHV